MHRRYVGGLKENFSSVFKKKKKKSTKHKVIYSLMQCINVKKEYGLNQMLTMNLSCLRNNP